MENRKDYAIGHGLHSPLHNRFDTVRDSDVYNSISSSNGWKSILSSGNIQKIKNQWPGSRPCGMTSDEISYSTNPNLKSFGGKIQACLTHGYEKDFVLEARLNDKIRQEVKESQKKFNLRRTTKTQE